MRISKELIAEFLDKGILLRSSYEKTDEELYKNLYPKRYEWLKPWYTKDDYNFRDKTQEELDAERIIEAERFAKQDVKNAFGKSTTLWVYMNDIQFVIKNLTKYGEVTKEFIENKINRELKKYNSPYGDFAKQMKHLLDKTEISAWSIYPTTYGIGIWTFYNYHAKENAQFVEKLLKEKHIEFYNEWSDAAWVYRFKISKEKENLKRISA